MESERIAILETKVDAIFELLGRIEKSVDSITAKQMEMGISVKVTYQIGKWLIGAATTVLSYTHWDQIIAFIHYLTNPPKA